MFDCRGCKAKDAELVRAYAQIGELQDRVMAGQGVPFQSGLAGVAAETVTPQLGQPSQLDEPEINETDEEWEEQQLEQAAHEAEKTGRLRPDFPT